MVHVIAEIKIPDPLMSHKDGFSIPFNNSETQFGEILAQAEFANWIKITPVFDNGLIEQESVVTIWEPADRASLVECQQQALNLIDQPNLVWRFVPDEKGGIDRVGTSEKGEPVIDKLTAGMEPVLSAVIHLYSPFDN